ncbi:phosphatidylserine decarboxylase [Alteromonadaceae bacterium Bs31]|nr:phosphatidylserine decarboxylase [Alteromonadaceae bacterium Bs31]
MNVKALAFVGLQYLVPQHTLSRLIGCLAACKWPWLKNLLINRFADTYDVNMAEAQQEDPSEYASFNDFFCRALKAEARPLAEAPHILCPADGVISEIGLIEQSTIYQAKGKSFTTAALLGGEERLASEFIDGSYCTVYLSPKDYHRIHMPVAGELEKMIHVPGALFSVNPSTVENVDALFAKNERLVCIFKTELGPMALVLVGAMIVASIETVWSGEVAPRKNKTSVFDYGSQTPISLERGTEMGRFKLGSTVIMLFPKDAIEWAEHMKAALPVCMGETMAKPGKQ